MNEIPVEVIRHARRDRVVSRFIDSIWSEIGRCQNCHSPDRNRHQIGRMKKEDVEAISWIVPHDPAATLQKLVDTGNIDLEHPEDSPVLTKPIVKVKHGGGPKFFPGSDTYRKFADFLKDYAAIRAGQYQSADQIPEDPEYLILLTEQQLRITEIPLRYSGKSLQVNLFGWDDETKAWSKDRCATAFSRVNAKDGVWQNQIQLVLSAHDPQTAERRRSLLLPPGRYRIEILIDETGRTTRDPHASPGEQDRVRSIEIHGQWPPGYQPPKIVSFSAE